MPDDGPHASHSAHLGRGWKCRPSVMITGGDTHTMAEIDGPGAIQSLWITGHVSRDLILRIYWDGQDQPSVETPLADFFAMPWIERDQPVNAKDEPLVEVNSLPVAVCPHKGMNCFWEMPFRKHCRITMQNLHPAKEAALYYQINYTLTEVPDDCAYFHAQFRRTNPLPYKEVYTLLDGVTGPGHYVGTAMGWGINNNKWWGEGEIKFYMDGDDAFPTICGTGTEDYFGGAWNWDVAGRYRPYTTPFVGMHWVIHPDGLYAAQHRHAMYRWHVMDPIRFSEDLRVTIQALGWRGSDGSARFLPGRHDICSVAYWYQALPTPPFPAFPDRDALEII